MKLPRDLAGMELAKALAKLGYQISHQTGIHIRHTTCQNGEHHHLSREELFAKLFSWRQEAELRFSFKAERTLKAPAAAGRSPLRSPANQFRNHQ